MWCFKHDGRVPGEPAHAHPCVWQPGGSGIEPEARSKERTMRNRILLIALGPSSPYRHPPIPAS